MSSPLSLHPQSIGDILDQTFRLYRRNFVPLATIAAVMVIPFALLQIVLVTFTYSWTSAVAVPSLFGSTGPAPLTYTVGIFAIGFASSILGVFRSAAIAVFVAGSLAGEIRTVRRSYTPSLRRWAPLLWGAILYHLAIGIFEVTYFLIGVLPSVSSTQSRGSGNTLVTACLCLLILPATINWFLVGPRLAFYAQTIILENRSGIDGLRQSWRLVRGKYWRTLGFCFLVLLLQAALIAGPLLVFRLDVFLNLSPALSRLITTVASNILQILIAPVVGISFTLYYYDLRVRQEGFDLQLRLDSLIPTSSAAPVATPGAAQ